MEADPDRSDGTMSVCISDDRNGYSMECIIRDWNFICGATPDWLASAYDKPLIRIIEYRWIYLSPVAFIFSFRYNERISLI